MKIHFGFAWLILCPGLAVAQQGPPAPTLQDPLNTVFLQTAQSSLSSALYEQSLKPAFGSAGFNRMYSFFESYQLNMNSVIDANNTAEAPMLEYRRLLTVAGRAATTKDETERHDLLGNFLFDSRFFLRAHPDATRIWVMRAAAALQLNNSAAGAEAGRVLLVLSPEEREDPHIQALLALYAKKGWLPAERPAAK